MTTTVDASLDFSVAIGTATMRGSLRGAGSELTLTVSDPDLLGGADDTVARSVAATLADRGIRLNVVADRPLATLGIARAGWLQRRITGSPHISVASVPAAITLLRLRRKAGSGSTLAPPPTPQPLVQTLLRRRDHPTTTHDPQHGGYPRLVLAVGPDPRVDARREYLLGSATTIGSGDANDIRLDGLDIEHAVVTHTAEDEFVLVQRSGLLPTKINGAAVSRGLLRTGTRIEVGAWTLVFVREEYADHGRPHGGRIGGELGHQLPQPPRSR
jgi:hypothetical protein